jgi:hypothetical protein
MISFGRVLPGEREGKINPEDYGFKVIREAPPTEEEEAAIIGDVYAKTKERTGMVIPELEEFLGTAALEAEEGSPQEPE